MTYKKNYKCQVHVTNEGFFNEEGQWVCWVCHQLDIFNNPDGKVLLEFEKEEFYLRLVDTSDLDGNLQVELFHDKKRIKKEGYRDMSTSVRAFGRFKSDIVAGGIIPPREVPNSNTILPSTRNPIVLGRYDSLQFTAMGDNRQYIKVRIEGQALDSTADSRIELFKCLVVHCVLRRVRLIECIITGSTILETCEVLDCGLFPYVATRECTFSHRIHLPNNIEEPLVRGEIGFSSVLALLRQYRLETEFEEMGEDENR